MKLQMGVNPSSNFRYTHFAKFGPNLWQIWQVLGPWASPYGANGKWPWVCTTTGLDNSTELQMEKIRHAVRDMGSASLTATHPDSDENTPPAWRAEGLKQVRISLYDEIKSQQMHTLGYECQETRQIWGIWKLRPAYSPETPNLGQNRWCFVPCDLEIWWMILENNRASLLCCFKLCATFHSHWWIQTGVTVRKRTIWVKFDDF